MGPQRGRGARSGSVPPAADGGPHGNRFRRGPGACRWVRDTQHGRDQPGRLHACDCGDGSSTDDDPSGWMLRARLSPRPLTRRRTPRGESHDWLEERADPQSHRAPRRRARSRSRRDLRGTSTLVESESGFVRRQTLIGGRMIAGAPRPATGRASRPLNSRTRRRNGHPGALADAIARGAHGPSLSATHFDAMSTPPSGPRRLPPAISAPIRRPRVCKL